MIWHKKESKIKCNVGEFEKNAIIHSTLVFSGESRISYELLKEQRKIFDESYELENLKLEKEDKENCGWKWRKKYTNNYQGYLSWTKRTHRRGEI